jgi:DNA-binding MarR family transcriptional regulator
VGNSESDLSTLDSETEITLGLLSAVADNNAVTQRSMAKELGIALGLANAYLKRCIAKGYIKVTHAPANRYAYYLTPQGFMEKSRLTARYLSISFNFFREARGQCAQVFETCAQRGWKRVALWGASDLVEIAVLCAAEYPVEPVGIVSVGAGAHANSDLPVVERLEALGAVDAVVITDLEYPQAAFEAVVVIMPRERVLTPPFLNVSRQPPQLME